MKKMNASGDVLTAHLAGEAVLLNLADKSYYRLNETAAFIWKEIENGASREEILSRILQTYDVSESDAGNELNAVIGDLVSRNLVSESQSEDG